MNGNDNFIEEPAIEIKQPLGNFFITRISAEKLLEVAFTKQLEITGKAESKTSYPFNDGGQRPEDRVKLEQISSFIKTAEAAFPNSIIIGANYTEAGELIEDDKIRWRVEPIDDTKCLRLIAPTNIKLASIIDGQHRLKGFFNADAERRSMQLLCAVYLDIPVPFQAFIFATINFNQKKVDRSLAYQLFGIGLEEESPETWSPDKTAVFLSRKLNLDEDSPFHKHIIVAAQNEQNLFGDLNEKTWKVSTATIVDGILKLFSKKPKEDKDKMHQLKIEQGRNRSKLDDDGTPLRNLYKSANDLAIYTIVKNYFKAVSEKLWESSSLSSRSLIVRTVGIQALFDVLYLLLDKMRIEHVNEFEVDYFLEQIKTILDKGFSEEFLDEIEKLKELNFAKNFFEASGRGRTRLRNVIGYKLGLISEDRLRKTNDYEEYKEILEIKEQTEK